LVWADETGRNIQGSGRGPVRLRLFSLLSRSGEACVCDLTEALDLPQSTISRHPGVLRHAGLISMLLPAEQVESV